MKSQLIRSLIEFSKATRASSFLFLLVAADCAFIIIHLVNRFTQLTSTQMLSLTKDQGYPELYQYLKEFWVIILLIFVFLRFKLIGYCIWILLFMYLLLDDALQIHETVGSYLAIAYDWKPWHGLRAKDFGELAVSGVAAAFFLFALWIPYARGDSLFKLVSKHLALMIVAMAFFGVLIDMIHMMVPRGGLISALFAVVEDGGEMIIMSLIVWYLYSLNELVKKDGSFESTTN